MPGILIEEHKHYGIDCKTAIWVTDKIKKTYDESGVNVLSDADFAISRKALRNCLKNNIGATRARIERMRNRATKAARIACRQ